MVNDADDGQITGIRLAAGRLASRGTAHTDDPVTGFGANGIDSNLFGTAVLHHLQMLVFEIGNPVRGNERLQDLDDQPGQ